MGFELDLDDVAAGNPKAEAELRELRVNAELLGRDLGFERTLRHKNFEAFQLAVAQNKELRAKLKPENREPPHCASCACGLPDEPPATPKHDLCRCGRCPPESLGPDPDPIF